MRFLLRLAATAAALWVAVELVPGIRYAGEWYGLMGVALVFGLLNAVVRPILYALTCPLIVLTLGLFIFILNGVLLLLTSSLASTLGLDFVVTGLGPAVVGALVVGVVSAVLSIFVGAAAED